MDDDTKSMISVSGIVGFVVIVGIGLITYGCQNSNQKYYDMAHDCIAAGGSFIPIGGNNSSDAICLKHNQSP